MTEKTALISVFNKQGIGSFASSLVELGWNIISSGGTARALGEAGVPARDVAELVGGEAILGHRVVTLSREVHAGLLARPDNIRDLVELERLGIPLIGLVCVDLYPLQEEIASPGSTLQSVVEKTDIGGPTMLRSAAKGRRIVVCDPGDRERVISWLRQGRPDEEAFISELVAKAEAVVADYCLASARYHGAGRRDGMVGREALACRYGENAHQTPAALFTTDTNDPLALDQFRVVAGAAPSYNNLCDVDRLLQTLTHIAAVFELNCLGVPRIAVAVKHGNACGAAVGEEAISVLQRMVSGDPLAIFGGLVMTNFSLGEEEADTLLTHLMYGGRRLLDGIIAPCFSDGAIEMLKRKKDKCRFLVNPALAELGRHSLDAASRFRPVRGGFLRQPNYTFVLDAKSLDLEKHGEITDEQLADLLLAWAVGSTSNSNTVVLARGRKLIGSGTGQRDRVMAAELAVRHAERAGHGAEGAVAYSDSFFPFHDGPEFLAKAGVRAILTSSGSIRDKEVKQVLAEHGVAAWFIPDALGRGFFGH